MGIFLYLRASLKRRLRVHLSLFIVLTCAMMLPLMISILRDSSAYGREQMKDASHQANPVVRIRDATPEYVEEFGSIPGLSATYEEGVFILDTENPDDKRDAEKMAAYEQQIRSRSAIAGIRSGTKPVLSFMQSRSNEDSEEWISRPMQYVNAMMFVIAIWIVASSYLQHIRLFQGDMAALRALGAKKRQINALFYLEFMLLFALAAPAAVALSSGLVYVIFTNFLQVIDVSNLAWQIFHVDMGSVGIHLASFFVLSALAMRYALWRGTVRRKKRLKPRRRIGSSFQNIYLRRASGGLYSCLLVSIPVVLVLLLLFNYTYRAVVGTGASPEYAIRLFGSTLHHDPFSQEELDYLRSLEGVAATNENRNSQRTYKILDDRAQEYNTVGLYRYSQLSEAMQQADFSENGRGVAVNKNHAYLKYEIGDTIRIVMDEQEIELEVMQLLNLAATDFVLPIFLSNAFYDELLGDLPVARVDIKLTDRAAHDGVVQALEARFSPEYYTLIDDLLVYEQAHQMAMGQFLLVCAFGSIMLLLSLFILSAKLHLYIAEQTPNIRTLYQIGAAKARLRMGFLRQTFFTALWGLLPPFALAAAMLLVLADNSGMRLVFDGATLAVNLSMAAVWLLVYVLPVRSALARIQIKEGTT
ncbi:MAG: FtsX-like permease family protein [Oscillospiraceae bacterium]|jgi:ABC-type antimicrobial peptide transport system permease subunit|nr:FtsX-like permease family protein [Oscillospiraceae bacterium]